MKKNICLLLFTLLFATVNAQLEKLSPDAEISVLTIGPGVLLNDAFGHNAFRVNDPQNNLDVTFDYGRFDFEAPNFYLNFAKGKLNYSLGKSNYYEFLSFYIKQDRYVKEQTLNLSPKEKQKLFDFLVENYKPENRNYLYEFFFDNCATKIKDVVKIATDDNITFRIPENFRAENFRKLIHNHVNKNSWGSLGIDIALGSVIDRKATAEEHMFLPDNIYLFFENATLKESGVPLVKESKTVYSQKESPSQDHFLISPLFILGIIGFIIICKTYGDLKKLKRSAWLDIILFSFTGIVGVFILLLWFATDHSGTHQNYNLLWAFALNLFVLPKLFKKTVPRWFIKYLKFLVILLCLLTLHWVIGVQVYGIALIPFLIALFLRYVFLIKYYNHQLSLIDL